MRPAHIHFQVSGRQDKIVTQMYFDGDPYNKTDPFLNSAGDAGRQELLVKKLLDPAPAFRTRLKNGGFRHGAVQGIADETAAWVKDAEIGA